MAEWSRRFAYSTVCACRGVRSSLKMFEAFRKNIQTVQDGITASLQRLSVGDRTPTTPTESKLNFSAGADVLELYQTQWATMHHLADQNSKEAEKIDFQIGNLVQECERQHNQVVEIHSLLAHLPNIMSQLHSLLNTIGSVRYLFEEVEGELLALEDLEEELNLQEQTLDMRLGLAFAREKKNHKLNQLKNELSSNHKAKVCILERELEQKRKEREETLATKFLQDIKEYKEHGNIKGAQIGSKESVKLEDIELEQDLSNLDSFLDEPA